MSREISEIEIGEAMVAFERTQAMLGKRGTLPCDMRHWSEDVQLHPKAARVLAAFSRFDQASVRDVAALLQWEIRVVSHQTQKLIRLEKIRRVDIRRVRIGGKMFNTHFYEVIK